MTQRTAGGPAPGHRSPDGGSGRPAPAVRLGVDVVDVARFARVLALRGHDLTDRVFTTEELAECGGRPSRLAARLAAKEAAAKALGTGIGPVAWHDVATVRRPGGAPHLRLRGRAAALAATSGMSGWTVSLAHDRGTAVAVVAARGPSDDRERDHAGRPDHDRGQQRDAHRERDRDEGDRP